MKYPADILIEKAIDEDAYAENQTRIATEKEREVEIHRQESAAAVVRAAMFRKAADILRNAK